jgi:hypothetical protein
VLNGSKQWITNGGYAGLHIVFAKTSPEKKSHGVSCFVVEAGTKGLVVGKAEHKMGLRGSNTVQLTFEDCRVPKANLLGAPDRGYAIALKNLDGGRVGIAAQACGIADAALADVFSTGFAAAIQGDTTLAALILKAYRPSIRSRATSPRPPHSSTRLGLRCVQRPHGLA